MSLTLGMKAQIRSMIFIAAEPIPSFWPMRSFIHHNPLHGLEKRPFEEAVDEAKRLFHGEGFLRRHQYQAYYRNGTISHRALADSVGRFVARCSPLDGVDLHALLMTLLTETEDRMSEDDGLLAAVDIARAVRYQAESERKPDENRLAEESLHESLQASLLNGCAFYEALDRLFATGIADELDELVIKSCLDFLDEGQSVWHMPEREKGFFAAWREVTLRNAGVFSGGRVMRQALHEAADAESVIALVMEKIGVPESQWVEYFRRELARLHGWAGFIRWRSGARHYYHARRYPADLVDYMAIRLTLACALIEERAGSRLPTTREALQKYLAEHPAEAWLRREFYAGQVLPEWATKIEQSLLHGHSGKIEALCQEYMHQRLLHGARKQARLLRQLADRAGIASALQKLDDAALSKLVECVHTFERKEGMLWLEAMESTAMQGLLDNVQQAASVAAQHPDNNRPFAQALFCIDTRSEPIRRKLESVGDYQTFGIAGFFGVPVSFMEMGKGNETFLCPVLLTPKNLVMEMSVNTVQDTVALTVMEKVVHELKESVLTPFVMVEAIGLLFGFDMVGKTLAPRPYQQWRSRLHKEHVHPYTHLLIDKLTRAQADSIVRAVQRAVIAKAVEHEFSRSPEDINDELVRELREVALGHVESASLLQQQLHLDRGQAQEFIERLRRVYRVNSADARLQMERLGRIGFTLDEQVGFVSQALRAIGLVGNFSRFVLCVGHGSQSENNPYESALDCGACGGNPGLFNARIFAQMANKPAVRKGLREQGIVIPDDTWFVPALHNTTTDKIALHDLDLLPASHPVYLDRLQNALTAASRLCAQERMPTLDFTGSQNKAAEADRQALRNSLDWSQVRPEWGLSRNALFIIGRRALTERFSLDGRAFLHSYDYRIDHKQRLLENILTGPLVVGQWINMEHYFSTVDNEHYGSGSKVYHNVAGRFGVMTGNLSDLRTGLPAQTVLANGEPYHEPMRLITVLDAPLQHVKTAIERVAVVRRLLNNGWIRVMVIDPESGDTCIYDRGQWQCSASQSSFSGNAEEEIIAS